MRIKQIARNHIEVTVTEGDLTSFDINMDSLTPDSPYLKSFLFKVMERVKNETGFDPQAGHILVEAQRRSDRIIFNIKRMTLSKAEKREKYKNARAVVKPPAEKVYIYGFEHFSDMTDALALLDKNILLLSAVYRFEGVYYCSFRTAGEFDSCASVMSEFCSAHDEYEFTDAILGEHGECIARGESVVSLIDGIKKYKL